MIGVIPYSTDNTDLAAYLCALGAKTPVLDRTEPRIAYVFELTEDQVEAVPHFTDGSGLIRAQAFANAKKMLLRMIKNV